MKMLHRYILGMAAALAAAILPSRAAAQSRKAAWEAYRASLDAAAGYVAAASKLCIGEASARVEEEGSFKGLPFVRPDASIYLGVFIRDYYYGCLTGMIPVEEMKGVYAYYKAHIDTEGPNAWQVPDVVDAYGIPAWMPGTDRPALDGNAFMVFLAALIYEREGDKAFLREELPYLEKLIENTFRVDGLAYCREDFNRVGFGFQDSVHMTGHLAFCSVLFYDAAVRAERLCQEVGADASAFREVADGVRANFLKTFWTGTFLRASDGLCKDQFDVMAAGYAVSCGLVKGRTARKMVDAFYRYNDELQVHGFYKYVPEKWYHSPGQVWESGNCVYPTGIYQWGAYWTVGSPYILGAILKVKGHGAAGPVLRDMLEYVIRTDGLFEECRSRDNSYHKAVHYVQSCGAVSVCLRMLQGKEYVY
ncbi:MAG: hypothetical protein IJM60_03400 [Bacteroidales bacterium]|nr:hypothetical protein [Bacteroidales bacterium]